MSEEDAIVNKKGNNKFVEGLKSIVPNIFDIFLGIVYDISRVGLQSILGGIFMIFSWIIKFMLFLFTKIIPFLLKYIGIPLFILGAILALIFFGGHIFFIVALMVGVFLYIKGIYTLTFNIPAQTKDMNSGNQNSSTSYKVGK